MFESYKPKFTESYRCTRQVAGRERQIEIDTDMLTTLWSADEDRPQTPAGVVAENIEFLDRLIAEMIAQGLADPHGDAPILISGVWYASEPDEGRFDDASLDKLKARLARSI